MLRRFADARRAFGVGTVVRATGDNPLVSAPLAERILALHAQRGADLSHFLGIPLGTGVEVVEAAALLAGRPGGGRPVRARARHPLPVPPPRSASASRSRRAPPAACAPGRGSPWTPRRTTGRCRPCTGSCTAGGPWRPRRWWHGWAGRAGGRPLPAGARRAPRRRHRPPAPLPAPGAGAGAGRRLLRLELPPGEDPEALLRGFGCEPREVRWVAAPEAVAGGEPPPEAKPPGRRGRPGRREAADGPGPGGVAGSSCWTGGPPPPRSWRRYRGLGRSSGSTRGGRRGGSPPSWPTPCRCARREPRPTCPRRRCWTSPPRRQGRGAEPRSGREPRVLVSFGGEDPLDLSGRMLRLLLGSRACPAGELTVAAGPRFGAQALAGGRAALGGPGGPQGAAARVRPGLHPVRPDRLRGAGRRGAGGLPESHRATTAGCAARPACRRSGCAARPPAGCAPCWPTRPLSSGGGALPGGACGPAAAGTGGGLAGLLRALRAWRQRALPGLRRRGTARAARRGRPPARRWPVPPRTYFACPRCGLLFLLSFGGEEKRYGSAYFFEEYRAQYGRTYLEDFEAIRRAGLGRLRAIVRLLARPEAPGGTAAAAPRLLDVGCALRSLPAGGARAGLRRGGHGRLPGGGGARHRRAGPAGRLPGLPGRGARRRGRHPAARLLRRAHLLVRDRALPRSRPGAGARPPPAEAGRGAGAGHAQRPRRLRAGRTCAPSCSAAPPTTSPSGRRAPPGGCWRRHGFRVERVRVTGHHPERFPRPWGPGAAGLSAGCASAENADGGQPPAGAGGHLRDLRPADRGGGAMRQEDEDHPDPGRRGHAASRPAPGPEERLAGAGGRPGGRRRRRRRWPTPSCWRT